MLNLNRPAPHLPKDHKVHPSLKQPLIPLPPSFRQPPAGSSSMVSLSLLEPASRRPHTPRLSSIKLARTPSADRS